MSGIGALVVGAFVSVYGAGIAYASHGAVPDPATLVISYGALAFGGACLFLGVLQALFGRLKRAERQPLEHRPRPRVAAASVVEDYQRRAA